MQVFVPNTSSNGVATSLGTSTLAAYDKVEDDWIHGGAEDSGIDLENLAHERRDSTGRD